jgi:hypothetical protein
MTRSRELRLREKLSQLEEQKKALDDVIRTLTYGWHRCRRGAGTSVPPHGENSSDQSAPIRTIGVIFAVIDIT